MLPDEEQIETESDFTADLSEAWDKAVDQPEAVPEPTETSVSEPVELPRHWPKEKQDKFTALPEDVRRLALETDKQIEAGWNAKFEDLSTERKSFEGLRESFAPLQQELEARGVAPQAYVNQMAQLGFALQTNPEATIKWLANACGVSLGLGHDEVQAQIRAGQKSYHDSFIGAEWSGFLSKNPAAERLRMRMGHELQINPQQPGETVSQALDRAFETVKWTDAGMRDSILAAKAQAEQKERQRKADLEKARKAGDRPTRGKTKAGQEPRPVFTSWKDELDRSWDELSTR